MMHPGGATKPQPHALSVADDLTVLAQGRVAAHFRRDQMLDELTNLVARVGEAATHQRT